MFPFKHIILASKSPRRKQLLKQIIYDDEGVIIKEGVKHFVENEADTWGLSIGVI